jgi:Zn-dependent protease with chaperone function
VQEFVAAHEIAHVVLQHMFWRRILPAAARAITLAVLVFVGLWLAVHHPAAPAAPLVLVLGALGLLGAGNGAWALLARTSRRYENDADQLARAWGYTLAGSPNAHTHGESWLTTSRLYRPFRMHPLPHERARASDTQESSGVEDSDRDEPEPTSSSG